MALKRETAQKLTLALAASTVALALAGCAGMAQDAGTPRKETIYAVTASNKLISFNAGQPGKVLMQKAVTGLQANEVVLGIDYRVAKGMLYAIGSSGRLYRLDAASGAAQMVGAGPLAVPPSGSEFGFDFNPTVDRIRFVSNTGQNMRLHPDTGAVVDSDANAAGLQIDGALTYAAGDVNAGQTALVVGAGYTYNKQNEKLTTNFVIDASRGVLATQGTREGKMPVVSPNTGQLFTVGALGIGAFQKAAFDISDLSNAAFIATSKTGEQKSAWYEVNLDSGKASMIGTIGVAETVVGIAIEP